MSKLISGKEALIALANGQEVQSRANNCTTWSTRVKFWTVDEIMSYDGELRLKPRTITINGTEVPAPFEPEEGEKYWIISDDYHSGYTSSRNPDVTIAAWRTEEEIKQVVAALRCVFGGES